MASVCGHPHVDRSTFRRRPPGQNPDTLAIHPQVRLVVWLIAALLKALVHPFRRAAWVDATSLKPESKVLLWKTKRGSEEAVAAEVAEQLRAGKVVPEPANAELRGG